MIRLIFVFFHFVLHLSGNFSLVLHASHPYYPLNRNQLQCNFSLRNKSRKTCIFNEGKRPQIRFKTELLFLVAPLVNKISGLSVYWIIGNILLDIYFPSLVWEKTDSSRTSLF